jgi:hypothetical protein
MDSVKAMVVPAVTPPARATGIGVAATSVSSLTLIADIVVPPRALRSGPAGRTR